MHTSEVLNFFLILNVLNIGVPVNIHTKNHLLTTIVLFFAFITLSGNSFADNISIMHPYVRAVPEGQPNSAAFMVLKNNTNKDRALVNARSNVSNFVELHTHKKEGGMLRMRRVEKIDIKANSKTVLKPGGLHVMFIGLKHQLSKGGKVDLELIFDDGKTVKLSVPIKLVKGMMHKKKQH